ncbi:DUF4136 domain-containing protein [Adhaeribacter aquaticus]|uniref:DUF4136 domain-containing protein n=1 Tax=Adhaeribacter aquaticus TaxID=299567 RepID=UPI0004182A79|nr:DUF4136 domain-containing protein [Adhaeribacter aquaticus]
MRTILLILIALTGLASCSTTYVKSVDSDNNFAISNYKTFNFYEISANGETANGKYNDRINILKNEVRQQLEAKGLTLDQTNPDLLVNIGVVTTEKVQTRETNIRTDGPFYMGQRRYTWRAQQVPVGKYKLGTVTIDLVDPKKNEMVWQGIAEGTVPKKDEKLQETVEEGLTKLFSRL